MTQTMVAPELQLDKLANDHSQLKAQMQLICARKQDSLAQAKFKHKKRIDQLLRIASCITHIVADPREET